MTYLKDELARRRPWKPTSSRGTGAATSPLRRQIEPGLRSRQVTGVVATNALELGIDIGQLEAGDPGGYPGRSPARGNRRAGPAGALGQSPGALGRPSSPLDQYIVAHPDYFFARSPEHGLVNPDLLILMHHIKCAAFELPFEKGRSSAVKHPLPLEVVEEFLQIFPAEPLPGRRGARRRRTGCG